jgi:hypothetical protein
MAKTKKETAKKGTVTKKTAPKKIAEKPGKSIKALKPMAKSTKKPEPKVKIAVLKGGKGKPGKDKTSETLELKAEIVAAAGSEEEEDEDAPSSGGMSASGLAMAAATAGAETSAGSLKNFRHHPDIENFYRFIYENDLRYEALEIIDVMATQRETIKANRAARARPN